MQLFFMQLQKRRNIEKFRGTKGKDPGSAFRVDGCETKTDTAAV